MLDNNTLRTVLQKFAPGVDFDGEGIFSPTLKWLSTETFYRMTEEYVPSEQKLAYKFALEIAFPGKKAVL